MAIAVGKKQGPQINITPLVDVVLVLLIIFMVITPMLHQKIWLDMAKDGEGQTSETPLLLHIGEGGELKLNDVVRPKDELMNFLRDAFSKRRDKTLIVDADDGVAYAQVASWVDQARALGALSTAVLSR